MRKTFILIIVLIGVVTAWMCLRSRKTSWDGLLRQSFCRYAAISSLETPLRCMQTGHEATAQQNAMHALTRAAGCAPVTFTCWERLFETERLKHGDVAARDALRFLRDWCVPPNGLLQPPVVS